MPTDPLFWTDCSLFPPSYSYICCFCLSLLAMWVDVDVVLVRMDPSE